MVRNSNKITQSDFSRGNLNMLHITYIIGYMHEYVQPY